MYSTLLLEFSEDIAKITLNRPDKLNAINAQMIAELQCGIDAIEKRHSRVVIVTGAGASFFFFLAEDGIRALYVTGVQTCALPICDSTQCAIHGCDRRLGQSVQLCHPRRAHGLCHLLVAAAKGRAGLRLRLES